MTSVSSGSLSRLSPSPRVSQATQNKLQSSEEQKKRIGLWLIGARGSVAGCVSYGLAGLVQGLLEPTGIATERGPLGSLPLVRWDQIVLGGHDVVGADLSRTASELVRGGVLSGELVAAAAAEAAAFDARIRPGVLDSSEVGGADLDPAASVLGALGAREQVQALAEDLRDFRREHDLERVVVVYLASTEAWRDPVEGWDQRGGLEDLLDGNLPGSLPASSLYAYAAFSAGCPFINFTPNRGATLGGLRQMAVEEGLPHCGNDGKTGETLLKSTLAPMFAARALKVLAWQGYNMLGNRDGEALADPTRSETKKRTKDAVVRSILDDPTLHSQVAIDYVPSLGDWKTAWDLIHFEGFLGARMSLQFTWAGSDSALAAPLVLDLVRLVDLAHRDGEVGAMDHTACYFKAPVAGGSHDFHAQFSRLLDYAHKRTQAPA